MANDPFAIRVFSNLTAIQSEAVWACYQLPPIRFCDSFAPWSGIKAAQISQQERASWISAKPMGFQDANIFSKVSKFHVFIPPLQMYIHLHFFWTETPSGVVKVFEGICATSKRTKPWRCQHSARHIVSSTWKVLLIIRSLASNHWLAKYTAMIWCDILYHAYFHDISLRIWHSVAIEGWKEMPLDITKRLATTLTWIPRRPVYQCLEKHHPILDSQPMCTFPRRYSDVNSIAQKDLSTSPTSCF